jgi:hypothetical protein
MKFDVKDLAAQGFTPAQINLLLDQAHQRKVEGSNVVLSAAEIEEHRKRFAAKKYTSRAEVPMKPRQASKLEAKYGLNKNLRPLAVDKLIAQGGRRKLEDLEE